MDELSGFFSESGEPIEDTDSLTVDNGGDDKDSASIVAVLQVGKDGRVGVELPSRTQKQREELVTKVKLQTADLLGELEAMETLLRQFHDYMESEFRILHGREREESDGNNAGEGGCSIC